MCETSQLFDLGVLPTDSRTFSTDEEAMIAVKDFAMRHGYGISTAKSSFYCGRKIIVYLQCDRSRPYMPRKTPTIRKGGTKSTNCPFRMVLRRQKHTEKEGEFKWLLAVKDGSERHNHPAQPISTHSSHRKSTIQQHADQISAQIRRGIPSREIIRNIKAPWLSPRDIYNFRAKLNKNERMRVIPSSENQQDSDSDDQQMIDQQIQHEISLAEITRNTGDRGIPSQMTNVMQLL